MKHFQTAILVCLLMMGSSPVYAAELDGKGIICSWKISKDSPPTPLYFYFQNGQVRKPFVDFNQAVFSSGTGKLSG